MTTKPTTPLAITRDQYITLLCALNNYIRGDWPCRRHLEARRRIRQSIQTHRHLELAHHNHDLPKARRLRTYADLRAWRTMFLRRLPAPTALPKAA